MECRLCGHPSTHKHEKAPNGSQRYFCPHCKQTFNERIDTMSYHRAELYSALTRVPQTKINPTLV